LFEAFIVEDEGYRAMLASQASNALDLVWKRRPALIITDLMMPRMTGSELIARLREDPRMQDESTPIVLMTAAGADLAAESEADEILLKPFNVATVVELLHHYLDS
jgi:CheY-like chemotaxis protein